MPMGLLAGTNMVQRGKSWKKGVSSERRRRREVRRRVRRKKIEKGRGVQNAKLLATLFFFN